MSFFIATSLEHVGSVVVIKIIREVINTENANVVMTVTTRMIATASPESMMHHS